MIEPVAIYVDAPITRRKRFCVVVDAEGTEHFRARLLWDCFEYLEAEGVQAYWLRASDPRHPGLVPGVFATKKVPPWQN